MLAGPIGAGSGIWRRWASDTGRKCIVANHNCFPTPEWVQAVLKQVDLPTLAVHSLAQRAGRPPEEFLNTWRVKTPADREHFWKTLTPNVDDESLRAVADLAVDQASSNATFDDFGEGIVPLILRLVPTNLLPGVLFIRSSHNDLSLIGRVAVQWAMRAPAVPLAVAVPTAVWHEFLTAAPESSTKALLKEGELLVPTIDPEAVERSLREAGGGGSAIAALTAVDADVSLIESAVDLIRATAAPPTTEADGDCARSAAERFLFSFLESLPETAGRFELNATLDFPFGRQLAEVDLLCRSPRIAIELDGYFHFLAPEGYRRDRMKDWELQKRGYLVLRFLADDVIRQLEVIRDRILEALALAPLGGQP